MRKGQHHTLESRKKMSNNWTKEKKKELSEKRTGTGNPMYGKHLSPETKALLSSIRKEIPRTEEWCENISKALTGNPNASQRLAVHHIYYDKKEGCNESELHLVPLCITCHLKTNTKREYWIECLIKKIEEYLKENGDDK